MTTCTGRRELLDPVSDVTIAFGMSTLLQTKYNIPAQRAHLVARPRLVELLNSGITKKLIIVSAPAGFGKTTLIAEWVHGLASAAEGEVGQYAWLSLDEKDNDPSRFLSYLIAALRRVAPGLGQSLPNLAQSPQTASDAPAPDTSMTPLINELVRVSDPFLLILDDYHVITSPLVHETVGFLLEHLPPSMHLVLISRTEPPLPLARLRAHHQLVHINATELRFTASEIDQFLNRVMKLDLGSEEVARLGSRTEGWVAGLQLAALSLQRHESPTTFVNSFAGDDRHIMDYLMEEILAHQPDDLRDFLLRTAILERLSAPLCDAVTGLAGSQQNLEMLEQQNLFLIPLDNKRQWYRYHHLFAEFLQVHLRRQHPELAVSLHMRASDWYAAHDLEEEAIEHALAANAPERAAELIESTGSTTLWQHGRLATLLRWSDALPAEVRHRHPSLLLLSAWALYGSGKWDMLDQQLNELEQSLSVHGESTNTQDILGQILVLRAEHAIFHGNIISAQSLLHQAHAILSNANVIACGMVAQGQGYIFRLNGDIRRADEALARASVLGAHAGNLAGQMFALYDRAELRMMEGKLGAAVDLYEQIIHLAGESARSSEPVRCGAYIGLANVLREQNKVAEAAQMVTQGIELSREAGISGFTRMGYIVRAQIQQAQAEATAAQTSLQQAMGLAQRTRARWVIEQTTMFRARLLLAQGEVFAAARWVQPWLQSEAEQPVVPTYLYHLIQITCARLLHDSGELDSAAALLAERRALAEANGWQYSLVEIAMLEASCLRTQGNDGAALAALDAALAIAEAGGMIRMFLDLGPAMGGLLRWAVQHGVRPHYARVLLDAISQTEPSVVAVPELFPSPADALTGRELEILQLMASGLSNREIGERLFIALGTVGKHTSNIFAKLNVSNRAAAVLYAREHHLL